MSQKRTATRVLDILTNLLRAGAAGFVLAGVVVILVSDRNRDRGFGFVAVGVIFLAMWVLISLYRGRYRL